MTCGVGILPAQLIGPRRLSHRNLTVLNSSGNRYIIHLEHQARSEAEFNKRMFRYFARLHEKHALPVYPVVIFSHDAPRRPEPDCYRVEFPGWTPT